MQATRPFEQYEHVPQGATLNVKVKIDAGQVQNDVAVFSAGDDDEEWSNADVLNRVKQKTLTGQGYIVRISTFAQSAATGRVEVSIDGHSKPYHWPLNLAANGSHLCGVFIKMAQ